MEKRGNEQSAMEVPNSDLILPDRYPTFNRLKKIVSSKLRDTARALTNQPNHPHDSPAARAFLEASDWVNRGAAYESLDFERLDRDIQGRVRHV